MEDLNKKIKKYISTIAPAKLGLTRISRVKVKEIPRGGYNHNFLINLGKKKFVLRANIEKYIDVENQILYEFEVLRLLKNTGLSPKPFLYDLSHEQLPYDFLIEEYIEGETVKVNNQFINNCGKALKRLHSIPRIKESWLVKYTNPLVDHLNLIRQKMGLLRRTGQYKNLIKFFEPYLAAAKKYIERYKKNYKPLKLSLNHGDLVIENIINTSKGLCLVDWQSARIDDAAYDLAYFTCDLITEWHKKNPFTKKQKQIFYSSYGASKKLLERVKIRQPLIYLELYVHVTQRNAEIRENLKKAKFPFKGDKYWSQRLKRYESLLNRKKIKKDLAILK